jgi:elongator complex protein 2
VLSAHTLSVVKLSWAGDDWLLVSVGRDRQWSLFDTKTWSLVGCMPKAHGRIIWDVDFAPLEMMGGNKSLFVTASRDKCVKFWVVGGERDDNKGSECIDTVKFNDAVTACAFLKIVVGGWGYVAVGLENGGIYILGCKVGGTEWKVVKNLEEEGGITHAESVTCLQWRPNQVENGKWELASCGDDCSVRIYEVVFSGNDRTNGTTL